VGDPDFTFYDIVNDNDDELVMRISRPHNLEFRKMFNSWIWIFFVRILSPLIAFSTSILALFQLRRLRNREEWSVSGVIFAVEFPINLLLAWSQIIYYGGFVQKKFDAAGAPLYTGTGAFSTFILALYLFEENTHLSSGSPRRNILVVHRFKIIMASVFMIGNDIFQAARSLISNQELRAVFAALFALSFFVVVLPTYVFVAPFLFKQVILSRKIEKSRFKYHSSIGNEVPKVCFCIFKSFAPLKRAIWNACSCGVENREVYHSFHFSLFCQTSKRFVFHSFSKVGILA